MLESLSDPVPVSVSIEEGRVGKCLVVEVGVVIGYKGFGSYLGLDPDCEFGGNLDKDLGNLRSSISFRSCSPFLREYAGTLILGLQKEDVRRRRSRKTLVQKR